MASPLENLEKMIGGARDGALLRYSLGLEHVKAGRLAPAIERFREALERDALYSAAWRALGKALEEHGQAEAALEAFRRGVEAAQKRGDKQAAKEMIVFARRLEKRRGGESA